MTEQTSSIISKVWSLCNPLRDDGVSYGDYLEQLTYLIYYYIYGQESRAASPASIRFVPKLQ